MSVEQVSNANKANTTGLGKIYEYPDKTGDFKTLLMFKQYSYQGAGKPSSGGGPSVVLPLPQQLVDSFSVSVGSNELGVLGSLAASAGSTLSNGSPNSIKDSISKVNSEIARAAKAAGAAAGDIAKGDSGAALDAAGKAANVAQYLTRAGLASIAPDAVNGFGAGSGTAANPFATLVFSGVPLKEFTFNWTLSPENEKDSNTIRDIIQTIRACILPDYQSPLGDSRTGISAIDKGLLTYPMMVDVVFQGIDPSYYFKLKTCMVSNFSTDFTPNGLAIMRGGKPAVVNLSLTLQEANIHTRGDYSDSGGTDTGGSGGSGEVAAIEDSERDISESVSSSSIDAQIESIAAGDGLPNNSPASYGVGA